MTLGVQLYIDGTRVPDGTLGLPPTQFGDVYADDGLNVSWGRATTVDQPAPATCQFTLSAEFDSANADLFGDLVKIGRRLDVDAGASVRVFTGVISDVSMVVTDDMSGLLLNVTADDLLADLANRPAAATPWAKETVQTRFDHVLQAARLNTTYTIASDVAPIMVRKADADTAVAADLLADIAVSVDAVLWAIARPADDPYLRLESPALRAPLRRLAYVAPWVVIVDVSTAAGALPINPCVPDLAPIEFRQTMSDLTTGVAVTYYTPDPTDSTAPDIGTTTVVSDAAAESPARPWGARRMNVDSQLTNAADAQALGQRLVSRLSQPVWRLNNVSVDNRDVSDADMARLLNSPTRAGLPVTIQPLPPWAPPAASDRFAGYVEGGNLTSTRGVWAAELWLSLAQGYAGVSARYQDIPQTDTNWQYQDVDPSIRYSDLVGVAGP